MTRPGRLRTRKALPMAGACDGENHRGAHCERHTAQFAYRARLAFQDRRQTLNRKIGNLFLVVRRVFDRGRSLGCALYRGVNSAAHLVSEVCERLQLAILLEVIRCNVREIVEVFYRGVVIAGESGKIEAVRVNFRRAQLRFPSQCRGRAGTVQVRENSHSFAGESRQRLRCDLLRCAEHRHRLNCAKRFLYNCEVISRKKIAAAFA